MNNVFQRTLFKGKESLFFVLPQKFILCWLVFERDKTSKKKAPTKREKKKKGKLIPITSIESSSHVVAEEKKTVVVVVVDRLKNRLDSRRPRGGAARDVARGKRRGEYCLSSLPPPRFFWCVCARSFFFSFLFRRLWSDAMRERERLTKGVPIAGAR